MPRLFHDREAFVAQNPDCAQPTRRAQIRLKSGSSRPTIYPNYASRIINISTERPIRPRTAHGGNFPPIDMSSSPLLGVSARAANTKLVTNFTKQSGAKPLDPLPCRVAARSGPRLISIFVGSITATEIVPSIALGLELLHSTVIVVHYVAVPECVKSAIGRSAYLVVWVLNLVCHDVTPTRTDTIFSMPAIHSILTTAASRFGDLRRRILSWCRRTRISASNAARGRNSPIKAHQINLQRLLIDRTINRFAGVSQLFWVCGRDTAPLNVD
jgi:hypothetical protein